MPACQGDDIRLIHLYRIVGHEVFLSILALPHRKRCLTQKNICLATPALGQCQPTEEIGSDEIR